MSDFDKFLKDFRKYRNKKLSQNELNQLMSLYKLGDETALDKIAGHNVGLVVSISEKYFNLGIENIDVLLCGMYGLARAIKGFEPSKGFKFSTYATPWISGEIKQALENSGAVKLSEPASELYNKIRKVRKELKEEHGKMPSIEEIALKSKISVAKIKLILFAKGSVKSLDEEITLEDSAPKNPNPKIDQYIQKDVEAISHNPDEDTTDEFLAKTKIDFLLNELESEEKEFLINHYGLNGREKLQGKELAKKMSISPSRVTQLKNIVFAKIRKLYSDAPDEFNF